MTEDDLSEVSTRPANAAPGRYVARRHHELRASDAVKLDPKALLATRQSPLVTHLARIEVGPTELPKLLENGNSTKVTEALKEIGYAHVTLDLQGYRRGSLNETKGQKQPLTTAGKVG